MRPFCTLLPCTPSFAARSNPFTQQVGAAAGTAAANAAVDQVASSARTGAFGAWGGGIGNTQSTNQSADYTPSAPALNGGGGDGNLAAREAALARREAELSRREAQLAAAGASGGVVKVSLS
jgi:hypothetical protein